MDKKNLIIIMADQLRYDVLGKGYTPTIDAIREEGSECTNMYCGSPLCVPSRGAFFTGCYPNVNGSIINPWEPKDAHYGDVRKEVPNLYKMLENDYEVIHSGKQHLFTEGGKLEDRPDSKTRFIATEKTYRQFIRQSGKTAPGGRAFKARVPEMVSGKRSKVSLYSTPQTGVWDEEEKYFYDRFYSDNAVKALRERKGDKPLFLSAMFVAPHPPFNIPEPWFSRVKSSEISLPENVGEYYERQSPLQMYNLPGVVGSRYMREEWKESWRVYLGLCAMLDDCVKAIVDELKAQGIWEDSVVIFTADHGEMLGSHGLFQKMCMYEEASHVPFYIRFPEGCPLNGRTVERTVSNIDVMPTLLEYLGREASPVQNGISLLPDFRGEQRPERTAFMQYDGNGARSNFQRACVRDGYKLICDLFKDEMFVELYYLKEDPQEKNNLAFDPRYDSLIGELYHELSSHMQRTEDMVSLLPLDMKSFREFYRNVYNNRRR